MIAPHQKMKLKKAEIESKKIVDAVKERTMDDPNLQHIPEEQRSHAIDLALEITKPTTTMVECGQLSIVLKRLRGDEMYTVKQIDQKILKTVYENGLTSPQHYIGVISQKKNGSMRGKNVKINVEAVLPLVLGGGEFPNDPIVQYFQICYGRFTVQLRNFIEQDQLQKIDKRKKLETNRVVKMQRKEILNAHGVQTDKGGLAPTLDKRTLTYMCPGIGSQKKKCKNARGDNKEVSGPISEQLNPAPLCQKIHYDDYFNAYLRIPIIAEQLDEVRDDRVARDKKISQLHKKFMERFGPTTNYMYLGFTEEMNQKMMYDPVTAVKRKLDELNY